MLRGSQQWSYDPLMSHELKVSHSADRSKCNLGLNPCRRGSVNELRLCHSSRKDSLNHSLNWDCQLWKNKRKESGINIWTNEKIYSPLCLPIYFEWSSVDPQSVLTVYLSRTFPVLVDNRVYLFTSFRSFVFMVVFPCPVKEVGSCLPLIAFQAISLNQRLKASWPGSSCGVIL